jgi:uncharacterized protein YecE (DUF72 family)
LPPTLPFDAVRMAAFLTKLPRSTAEAAHLARHHDERMTGRAWVDADADRPLRQAVEVRHPSYETPAFLDILHAHNVAVVLADSPGRWPVIRQASADFRYARLHGAEELYASGYDDESLQRLGAGRHVRLLRQRRQGVRPTRRHGAPREATRGTRHARIISLRREAHLEPASDVGPSSSYFEGPA